MKKFNIILISMMVLMSCFVIAYDVQLNMTFDDADGIYNLTFAEDFSQNGYDGRVENATRINGVKGEAYFYDGKSLIEMLATTKLEMTNSFTISLWAKQNASIDQSEQYIYSLSHTGGTSSYRLRSFFGSTQIGYSNTSFAAATNLFSYKEPYTMITAEEWENYVWIVDKTSGRSLTYKNNQLVRNETFTDIFYGGLQGFYLGTLYKNLDKSFIGGIDELLIYNRTLTESERTTLFNSYQTNNKNIMCIGDSITEWSRVGYCQRLTDIERYGAFNFGIAGVRVEGLLTTENIDNATETGINNSVLLIGTNNVLIEQDTYYNNLTQVVEQIKDSNITVYISTIPPRNFSNQENVTLINNKIRRVSYEQQVAYMDLYNDVFGGNYTESDFQDGVHPTEAKFSDMADYYDAKIQSSEQFFNCKASGNGEACFGGLRYFFLNNYTKDQSKILNISFNDTTDRLDINCTGTNILLDNMDEVTNRKGFYDVYHNDVFVHSVSTYTYNLATCSNWTFFPSNLTANQLYCEDTMDETIDSLGTFARMLGLFVIAVMGLIVFKSLRNENGGEYDLTTLNVVIGIIVVVGIIAVIGILILSQMSGQC